MSAETRIRESGRWIIALVAPSQRDRTLRVLGRVAVVALVASWLMMAYALHTRPVIEVCDGSDRTEVTP